MSHLNRTAIAAASAFALAAPGSALAGPSGSDGSLTAAGGNTSVATISAPAGAQTVPSNNRSATAQKSIRVQIGATTGVIYLNRTETKQVGQGGAWVVAGAIGVALAPQTAGLGTIAAIGVGIALGSVGSKLIDQQLAAGQCLKLSTPWLSLGTVVKVGWSPC